MKNYLFVSQITLTAVILVLVANNLTAQVYEKFEKTDNDVSGYWTHTFGFKSNGISYSVNGKGAVTLLKPNMNMDEAGKSITIGNNEEMQCGGSVDSKPCFFLKKWVEKSKKESIHAIFYDDPNLSATNAKKLFDIDYSDNKLYYPKNTLRCVSSIDESKFLIYYTAPYEKKSSFKLGFFLGNNKLEKITHKTIELPFEAEYDAIERDHIEIKVANDGTVYFLVRYLIDETNSNFAQKQWNHKFFVGKMTPDGKVTKITDVILDGEEFNISSMTLNYSGITNKAEIIGTAISSKTYQATFFKYGLGVDDFKKVEYINFPKELLDNATVEAASFAKGLAFKHNATSLPSWMYKIRKLIPQSDASLLVVAEQYTMENSYHIYGKMLVLNLAPENQIKWATTVNQRKNLYGATQNSSAEFSFYPQFFVTQTEKAIYFIYNTEFDLEPDAYTGTEKDKLDRMTFVSINSETGQKIKNNSIYIKKNSNGYLPSIHAIYPNNVIFGIDGGGRVKLD